MGTGRRPHFASRSVFQSIQLRALGVIVVASLCGKVYAAHPLDRDVSFDIPAQTLARALQDWSAQAGVRIMLASSGTTGRNAEPVKGTLRARAVLGQLLSGSGLTYHEVGAHTVTVEPAPAARAVTNPKFLRIAQVQSSQASEVDQTQSAPSRTPYERNSEKESREPARLEEVVVTGTLIRGVIPESSPLTTYSRDDILQSGANTLDQFARKMPQNFSAADGTASFANSRFGLSQIGGTDFAGSGFNLHGLGTGATLTLLDGHRVSGAGQGGDLVDISMIPVSAVERIEVLTDGAAALYGADAVAGVVNIILRKNLDGLESSARYGAATDGGAGEITLSQVAGTSWTSGGGLVSLEHDHQDGLLASERNFIPEQGGRVYVLPALKRDSVLLTGHQQVFDATDISADAFFSRRAYDQDNTQGGNFQEVVAGDVKTFGESMAMTHSFSSDWRGQLSEQYSVTEQSASQYYLQTSASPPLSYSSRLRLASTDLVFDGPLLAMPAGSLRAAAGASYRAEHLDNSTLGAANPIEGSLMRHVCSVFAEALVPIVGEGEKSGHTILEISVAARHDRYSDFGSVTNPKYGIAWYPTADLLIRGTFGKSFQPPTLFGLAPQPAYVTFNIPDPNSVSGFTDTLFDLSQGNAGLRAQNSRSYTAGFELRPHRIPQLKLSATFFHTRYNNLIGAIPVPAGGLFGVLQYQSLFAPFITRSPRLSEVQSYFARTGFIDLTGLGPAAVGAIVDGRLQNLATATQSGLDLQGSYTIVTSHGDIGISLAGTHFTRFNYQPSPALPTLDVVNHVGEPLAWKANGGVHWTFAGLHSDLIVNYANAYLNDYFTPATHVASWTTLDLNFGYDFGASNVFALLKGTSVAFTIQNALDRSPPAVPIPAAFGLQSLGYDPANASPLGRVLSLRVQVKW